MCEHSYMTDDTMQVTEQLQGNYMDVPLRFQNWTNKLRNVIFSLGTNRAVEYCLAQGDNTLTPARSSLGAAVLLVYSGQSKQRTAL